jgi:hypothetical protein
MSCGLRVEDVYGGFEEWLHRSIDENWKVTAVTSDATTALIESGFDILFRPLSFFPEFEKHGKVLHLRLRVCVEF